MADALEMMIHQTPNLDTRGAAEPHQGSGHQKFLNQGKRLTDIIYSLDELDKLLAYKHSADATEEGAALVDDYLDKVLAPMLTNITNEDIAPLENAINVMMGRDKGYLGIEADSTKQDQHLDTIYSNNPGLKRADKHLQANPRSFSDVPVFDASDTESQIPMVELEALLKAPARYGRKISF